MELLGEYGPLIITFHKLSFQYIKWKKDGSKPPTSMELKHETKSKGYVDLSAKKYIVLKLHFYLNKTSV